MILVSIFALSLSAWIIWWRHLMAAMSCSWIIYAPIFVKEAIIHDIAHLMFLFCFCMATAPPTSTWQRDSQTLNICQSTSMACFMNHCSYTHGQTHRERGDTSITSWPNWINLLFLGPVTQGQGPTRTQQPHTYTHKHKNTHTHIRKQACRAH